MDRNAKKNFIIDTIYLLIVVLIIFLISFVVLKYLFPFVLGTVIGFLVQKPARFLSGKLRIEKGIIAAILSVGIYIGVIAGFCFLVYRLGAFLIGLAEFLPILFSKITAIFDALEDKYASFFEYVSRNFNVTVDALVEESLQNFMSSFGVWISELAKKIIKNAPSFFISSIVTLVATCYISKDFSKLSKFAKSLLGANFAEKTIRVKNILVGSVFKLLKGYLILMLIVFSLLFAGFLLLRVENAVTVALIIAFADLLPVIGTGTILVPWAVISVLSGNLYLGIALSILFIIVALVRNFLEPKIIGNQIGVNSLFTLIVMFLGLKLLGVWGLILFPISFIVVIRYYKPESDEVLSQ